jgi:hypothetical protein
MTKVTRSLLCVAVVAGVLALPTIGVGSASAQATCRAKCTSEEQACLKRTNNKGQCGRVASACMSKCK